MTVSDDNNGDVIDFPLRPASLLSRLPLGSERDSDEESCPAFGFLRGLHDKALAIEFRFLTGNSHWHSYDQLDSWRYNPSVGLLLKFTGDVATLVLVHGSNLNTLVNQSVNLTDRGLQRHRITFLREMSEEELRASGRQGPTISRILVGECESPEEQREWMKLHAPAFLRGVG
jgi:hypothetical protein